MAGRITTAALLLVLGGGALANLEGPFVLWGPKRLSAFRRPALRPLEQDDLLDLYDGQPAIVVFNVQDDVPPRADAYPRLGRLLERTPRLYAPQDFLDVHPEYVNNETQTITVQGPPSERDAEITEKFERLQDVYGDGNVLAIMGRSSPSDEDGSPREKRGADDERREAPVEVVYNVPGKALLYSADYPVLRYMVEGNDTSEFKLQELLTASTDVRDGYSRLIVSFKTPGGKFTLRFRFPDSGGYWNVGDVEIERAGQKDVILNPPKLDAFFGAPKGFSFICGGPLIFSGGGYNLIFNELQIQPLLGGATKFGPAYNCVDTMTIPIWSGIMVTALLLSVMSIGTYMILDIKVMDKFENSKGKSLTISVSE